MKNKRILWMLAACTGILFLSGCNSEAKKTYNQAAQDLEDGIYDDALTGYEASAKAEYKTAESSEEQELPNCILETTRKQQIILPVL